MRGRAVGLAWAALVGAALLAAAPAAAQFTDGYSFLKAVRDADPTETQKYLDKPGTPVIGAHDPATGETVLHILVRRHDTAWMPIMLARGADVNARDHDGATPLLLAANLSDAATTQLLLQYNANPNLANGQGETPLIVAVHHRDLPTARLLVAGGADATRTDHIAGKSARDYAREDARGGPAMLRVLDQAKAAAGPAKVAGPTLPR